MGMHLLGSPLLASAISVGEHPTVKLGPLVLDIDTVWATLLAAVVVIFMGIMLKRKATSGVPGKFQLAWEMLVEALQKQIADSIGPDGAKIVPLALTLFVFILVSNLFGVFGVGSKYEILPGPNGDINLPLAMALFVIVLVHVAAIRNRGIGGYLKHYSSHPFEKVYLYPFNVLMNLIDELVRPITLALRLFGNLLAGGLMLSLLAALVVWKLGSIPIGGIFSAPLTVVWKLFDMAIGAIQAFIFALLTIVYFETAMAEETAH